MKSNLDVLIFSHMYPSPERPVLGCFVENQARALMRHVGLRVAVVTGTPFGLSMDSPAQLLKSIRRYFKALGAVRWEENPGGPPVLRVPFAINRRWLPFPLRAISYGLGMLLSYPKLKRYDNPQALHAHTAYMDGSITRLLSILWKRPYWITEHTVDPPGPYATYHGHPLTQAITRWALKGTQGLIAVSQCVSADLKTFAGNTLPPVHLLPNSVDTELFYPSQSQKNPQNQPFHLLFVGSLDDNKNPMLLLDLFEQYPLPDCTLTLIGEGPLSTAIKQRIEQDSGLQQRVQLLPNQSRVELARWMREEADLLVLPSLQETFGVVLIEAMACGKPVIATRCGGPESIITEPFLGELIPVNNLPALRDAILRIRQNLVNDSSVQIREHTLAHYSDRVIVTQLKAMYSQP